MRQLEGYLPLVERALSAVQNASKKIKAMNDEIQSRGTTIERLQERLVTVSEEAERSRERADKLEARFEQVPTDGFSATFKPVFLLYLHGPLEVSNASPWRYVQCTISETCPFALIPR